MSQFELSHANPEHHLEIADAIKAHREGEKVQFLNDDMEWEESYGVPESWSRNRRRRRAPAPAVKWWSEPSHVPCPCWIRGTNDDRVTLVDGVMADRIFARHFIVEFKNIKSFEWAPTHLGPFQPCTIPS